jgi:hypothetical protein
MVRRWALNLSKKTLVHDSRYAPAMHTLSYHPKPCSPFYWLLYIRPLSPDNGNPKLIFFTGCLETRLLRKVTLPQHTLQILELLLLKRLQHVLVTVQSTRMYGVGGTYLNINMPSILPRLLEIRKHSLNTLPHHPGITRRLPRQRS